MSDWDRYIGLMNRINSKAGTEMAQFLLRNTFAEQSEVVEYAYALASKYGEASSALACEMYDALAAAQGASVPAAEPAATATYDETAKAVYGTMKNRHSTVPDTVGRLVKQAGADTMLQNAKRDGAEFAWIPRDDTCAFCLMLASNGWQHQSRNAMKNGHAAHIHANCNCEYVVRFDGKSTVEGYDPDEYLAMYENAEGGTWQEKVNSMRRAQYAEDKDRINAQKRAAYKAREELRKSTATLAEPLRFYYNGVERFIPQGAEMTHVTTIAGNGSDTELRIAEKLAESKTDPAAWSKKAGKITSGQFVFDIHWYEFEGVMHEPKIKFMKEKK